MKKTELLKKWGRIALMSIAGIGAVGAGMVMSDNSIQVSAYEASNMSNTLVNYFKRENVSYLFSYDENYPINSIEIKFDAYLEKDGQHAGGGYWSFDYENLNSMYVLDIDNFDFDNINIDSLIPVGTDSSNVYAFRGVTSFKIYSSSNKLASAIGNFDNEKMVDVYIKLIRSKVTKIREGDNIDSSEETINKLGIAYGFSADEMLKKVENITIDNQTLTSNYSFDLNNIRMSMRYSTLNVELGTLNVGDLFSKSEGKYTASDINNARNEGYNEGFSAGESSVDITADNEKAINDFLLKNNYTNNESISDNTYLMLTNTKQTYSGHTSENIEVAKFEETAKINAISFMVNGFCEQIRFYDHIYMVNIDNLDIKNFKYENIEKIEASELSYEGNYFVGSQMYFYTKTGDRNAITSFIKENVNELGNLMKQYQKYIIQNDILTLEENKEYSGTLSSENLWMDVSGVHLSNLENGVGTSIAYINLNYHDSDTIYEIDFTFRKYKDVMNGTITSGITEEDYNSYGESKYEEGKQAGIDSVDITKDNQEYADNYIEENNYHTDEDYQKHGDDQYAAGVNSVDKDALRQEGYDEGFTAGVDSVDKDAIKKAGYDEGVASVDITADNEEAINDYIRDNNMKTEEEYNDYGDSKYEEGKQAGIDSVDITADNQEYANNYIEKNNYHTDEDYQKYGDDQFTAGVNSVDKAALKQEGYDAGFTAGEGSVDKDAIKKAGYDEGVASVDITADNEKAINDYIQDNNMKTEEEYNSYGESKYNSGYKAHTFGAMMKDFWKGVKKAGKSVGDFLVTYIGFGWAWDKSKKFR